MTWAKITIEDRELIRKLTPEQYNFVVWLAVQWNIENPAKFFYVEKLDDVPEVVL